MLENLFYIFLCLVAMTLIIWRPLARLINISINWEIGLGAVLIILTFYLFFNQVISPIISEEDLAKKPCGSESPQGACYSLEKSLCEKAWSSADASCKAEIANLMKDRPSALLGPAVNRCKAKKMDQFLRFNRTNTESPFCKAYFQFIESH